MILTSVANQTKTRELPKLDISDVTDMSVNGYKVGDQVKWADPDNKCIWGLCTGVIMNGTEDYNEGKFVVYWFKSCTKHGPHKGTESDDITRKHVKIAFSF